MKPSLTTHLLWFLITIGTFVTGSQLARRDSPGGGISNQITSDPQSQELTPDYPAPNTTKKRAKTENNVVAASQPGTGAIPLVRVANPKLGNEEVLSPLTHAQIEDLAITATKSSDPVERRKAFDRLLREMQSDTFTTEQAMAMRSSLHNNGADGEQWRAFDYAWGANDPEAALAHIDQIPDKYRDGYTGNMLPGLASVEPQMAIDLVNTMEGRQHFRMTERLIEGLADYDIGYATDYVEQLAENGARGATHHMKRLAGEVMSTAGLADTVAWAEGLDAGPLQATALRAVAHEYTNEDPQAASSWAEQFVGQDQNSRLFGEVVREWGDVEAATAWVDSLEPSLAQRDALSAVYGFRGSREPHEAVQDIINMPSSEDRNFALNGFISGLAHQDGEAAVAWAAEITSPGMREAAMIRAGKQYFQQDQQAATEWFNDSGLPETALTQMTRPK